MGRTLPVPALASGQTCGTEATPCHLAPGTATGNMLPCEPPHDFQAKKRLQGIMLMNAAWSVCKLGPARIARIDVRVVLRVAIFGQYVPVQLCLKAAQERICAGVPYQHLAEACC